METPPPPTSPPPSLFMTMPVGAPPSLFMTMPVGAARPPVLPDGFAPCTCARSLLACMCVYIVAGRRSPHLQTELAICARDKQVINHQDVCVVVMHVSCFDFDSQAPRPASTSPVARQPPTQSGCGPCAGCDLSCGVCCTRCNIPLTV